MDTTKMSPAKSQSGSRSLTRALALAFNEWLLMVMLFANSIFTYVITKFADYSQLQSPCLICSRLDHILGKTKDLKNTHWDMFCSKHKSEISLLVYCHGKLIDVRGMCETCLLSFDTTNKSSAETYKLLVGKLGEYSNSDQSTSPRNCTCCNQMWIPKTDSTAEVLPKPETLSKTGLVDDVRTGKQTSTPKKSVRFNDMPHVGYTELKIHSDTEPEDEFFEDEGVAVKEDDHRLQNMDLETPPVITLPCDLATDKLLILDSPLKPLVDLKDQAEVHLPGNDVHVTSEKVLKEEEIISLDDSFVTSRAMEHSATVLKEKEDLIQVQDSSLTPYSKESIVDSLMEVAELIPVDGASETSEKVLKEEEISPLDHLLLASRGMEDSAAVMKKEEEDLMVVEEKGLHCLSDDVTSTSVQAETTEDLLLLETVLQGNEELLHLPDTSLTPDCKETPADVSVEEAELICPRDVTSTSIAADTPGDLLMRDAILNQEEEDLLHIQDTSLTPDCKESPADALMEKTELLCLNEVTSTPSDAAETSEHVLQREEKEELVHRQDPSLGEDSKENPADALIEKTEPVCVNDVTSTSTDAAETLETELMPLHVTSPEEFPESFTTNETPVETANERDTNQADMTSLESEYVVVSPSKSTISMPEDPTENCVLENKEAKQTFQTVASLSEMVSHTEAAPESESSSFNSMSVAAETNLDSGEWTQGGGGELLDLADAYNNIIVHNESSRGAHIEQWMSKDTSSSRVSQDLKVLLSQISSSRISPRISIDQQETKSLDYDLQLLIQKRMLERNESTLSLEGVSVSEIEGESEIERLKRQVDHDRKFLTGLYKELEEERSASAVATNQAMAMITRLQEEKATFQMEALQNLRMMEEQAEYDLEAIQKLNELLLEREKVIQDLEAEIEYFKNQTPQKKKLDVAENVMSNKVQNCLSSFKEERDYINSCLEKIENMVQTDVNGEVLVDNLATQESVSELRERVEKLKGDLYFLEHVVSSLEHGNEGVQFVKEIASHLQTLSMKIHNHTEN
ncbi:GTD-binding domain-containing protein [Hirschfeldia incana]|nr:GTD-binding domain-containing protein [Hirschfeldia incana]